MIYSSVKNNELLIIGTFPSTDFQVEAQTLIAHYDFDALIKLDLNRNLIFTKRISGSENESFNSVTTDSQDNIILIGEFEDTIFLNRKL